MLATILWSSSGLFVKSPLFDWSAEEKGPVLAFWRAVFASIILGLMVRRPRWNWRLIPMALCFVLMNYTFMSAMSRAEASVVIWLQHLAPAWVAIGSALFFKESLRREDLVLVVLAVCGVGVILADQLRGENPLAVALGIASGVTYAAVVLSLRNLRDEDPAWLATFNHLVTALLFIPFAVSASSLPHGPQWLYLAAFGAFQMGIPYVMFSIGLRRISGNQAAGLALLEPILVPVWVFVAWGGEPDYQPPRWSTFVGASFILTGLLVRFLLLKPQEVGVSASTDSTENTALESQANLPGPGENHTNALP